MVRLPLVLGQGDLFAPLYIVEPDAVILGEGDWLQVLGKKLLYLSTNFQIRSNFLS